MTDRAATDIFALPGYRRTLRVEPAAGMVRALLEDDLHAMAVDLRHDGSVVTGVAAVMDRAPWTTCPGALSVLHDTFAGVPLDEVTARRDKQANCTHLHDLAVLAAAHAGDAGPSDYAIAVSDKSGGERRLEIRCNGTALHRWTERDGVIDAPATIAGQSLMTLRDWIATLAGPAQEAARLLQWAGLVAHGRTLSLEDKRAALLRQPSCFTMQPERVGHAAALAPPRDFSAGPHHPLAGLRARFEAE